MNGLPLEFDDDVISLQSRFLSGGILSNVGYSDALGVSVQAEKNGFAGSKLLEPDDG